MADTTTTSQQATHAMSSLPPQLGPGGHPRYNPQNLERDRQGPAASMGYGGPPPPPGSYGNSYASYPPPPYGSGMHGNYGAGSMTGGPSPPGYPRGAPGYSVPPHSSAYGAPGYGPGPNAGPGGFPPSVHHPPYYGGGYESHYGGQPPPPGHPSHPQGPPSSYRGPSPIPPPTGSGPGSSVVRGPNTGGGGVPTVSTSSDPQHSLVSAGSSLLSKKARSPPKAEKTGSSSQQSPETTQQQQQHNLPDHSEVERLRAAAATEITTEEVKPIQTDFHFFVKDHIETYRKLAEEEVRGSVEDKDADLDPTLVNSNLNTRLMKAWEGLTKESRDSYMTQEEADRRRFMEDDEIASRHCATLTARGKSPRVVTSSSDSNKEAPKPKVKKETNPSPQKMDAAAATVPKTVAVKTQEEEKKAEVPSSNEDPKRSLPESSTGDASGANDIHESPTKKSKAE